ALNCEAFLPCGLKERIRPWVHVKNVVRIFKDVSPILNLNTPQSTGRFAIPGRSEFFQISASLNINPIAQGAYQVIQRLWRLRGRRRRCGRGLVSPHAMGLMLLVRDRWRALCSWTCWTGEGR